MRADSTRDCDIAIVPVAAQSAHITPFPQTERAARKAARQWFAGTPTLTLVAWRDQARERHCAALPFELRRSAAFNGAFACEVATIIAGGFVPAKPTIPGAWRLHGYTKDAGRVTCQVFGPDGQCEQIPLADFTKLVESHEWDNRPEDIQAMLDLAITKEMCHE